MHYYNRNLGDYAKKAGRLSMLQHGAYTLLLDACYDREKFPTEEEAVEWTWASTPEEVQAVKFVLSRFFELQDDKTYMQTRVYDEIQAYKIGGIQNRLIAVSREAKKQGKKELADSCDQLRAEIKHAPLSKTHVAWEVVVDALINSHERSPNQEPRTKNQEPITNIKNTIGASASDTPSDIPESPCGDAEAQAQNSKPEKPKSNKPDYPDWFEQLWQAYPPRQGGNDKRRALHAARARIKSGSTHEQLINAVGRYARYLQANGNWGTQYVMQTATFLGPGGHIENPWSFNHAANQHNAVAGAGSRKVSHSDQTRADAREALERLHGSHGDSAVRSSG